MKLVRAFWRFHDLGQLPAHVLWVDEENQRAVGTNAGLAENALAEAFEPGLGHVNIGHFVTDVVLAAQRVLLEPLADG